MDYKNKIIERHKPTSADWAKIRALFLKDVSLDNILKEMPEVDALVGTSLPVVVLDTTSTLEFDNMQQPGEIEPMAQ